MDTIGNKKTACILVAIVLIFGTSILYCSHTSNSDNIKVGVILPLTGSGAIYGNDLKRGIDLAYQQSPLKEEIELIYEDDAADVTKGINALNSLSFRGVDIIIGGIMSNVANGLLPIVNNKHILLLSPKATDVGLSRENDYFFRIWPTDDVDGKYAASYIVDSLRLKRIAILYDNGTYGVGINREFKNNLTSKKVEVVFDEGFTNGQTNFRTQIAKIKQTNPDVVFVPAYYKEVVLILKEMNELNCDFYVAGVSSYNEESVKKAAGKLQNKVFFTYPQYSVNSNNLQSKTFTELFRKHNVDREPNAFSAHGYDAFKIIEGCISRLQVRGENINSENLKYEMENMESFQGATGTMRFDSFGDAEKGLQIIWLNSLTY